VLGFESLLAAALLASGADAVILEGKGDALGVGGDQALDGKPRLAREAFAERKWNAIRLVMRA
jgi:hypothetical protein